MMMIIIIGDSWYEAAEAGRKSVAVATTVWHSVASQIHGVSASNSDQTQTLAPTLDNPQFMQIHFAILTNTFCNLEKYIL